MFTNIRVLFEYYLDEIMNLFNATGVATASEANRNSFYFFTVAITVILIFRIIKKYVI